MFIPNEISRWREQVGDSPALRKKFGDRDLETIEIDFHKQHDSPPPWDRIGDFYPSAKIFGDPSNPSCLDDIIPSVIEAAPPVIRTFRNARVIGHSAVLTNGGVHISYMPRSTDAQHFMAVNRFGAQGFIAEQIEDRVYVHFGRRENPTHFDLHALFLPNIEPGNYGSFVLRVLPQILHLAPVGIDVDCYVVAERTPWILEALRLLGFPERPIYEAPEVTGDYFAAITVCIMNDLNGFIRPETRADLLKFAHAAAVSSPHVSGSKKIYVSRDLQYLAYPEYRRMTNAAEVLGLVSARGFTIVQPETLTLRQQIGVFASASHIVGASGSGMLNAMFALQPARIVDIETESFGVAQHARIYSSSGHEYAFVFSSTEPDGDKSPILSRWTAPIELLEEALDWCLS